MSDEEFDEDGSYCYSDDASSGSENEEEAARRGSGGWRKETRRAGPVLDDNQIRILSEEDIKEQMCLKLNHVAQLLSVSDEDALILCISERWSAIDRLVEEWFQNTEQVAVKAGLGWPFATGTSNQHYLSSLASVDCSLCAVKKKSSDVSCLSCHHVICNECWTSGLSTYVDSFESLRATCLDASCGTAVPRSVWKQFLSSADYEQYEKRLQQDFVECSTELRCCPSPNCNAVALSNSSNSHLEVQCTCMKTWCFGCCSDDHRPASCSQVKAWNSKSKDTDLTDMYIKANSKACPKCNVMNTKDVGCAYKKCSQCSFHFCWLCLGPYSAHNPNIPGLFYTCNKFEKLRTEGRTDEDRTAMSTAQTLMNYEMSFERHLHHQGALDAAIKDLSIQEDFKSHRLTGKLLESDLHQLRQAVSQVVSSRRVLAWSYVFKFYQFEHLLEREFRLFETFQGKLESSTEELQSMLAVDLSSGQSHEPRVGTRGWEQTVVHLGEVVKHFLAFVMRFADNMDCHNHRIGWNLLDTRDSDKEVVQKIEGEEQVWRGNNSCWISCSPFNDTNVKLLEIMSCGKSMEETDRKTVLAGVTLNAGLLRYASNELKNDHRLVLAAVNQNASVLQYICDELKNDREIVLAAVNQDGYALQHASLELKSNRSIVLAAVNQDGYALKYASVKLKNDHKLVLAAVNQDGYALKYASVKLKNDHEIVLAAVNQNGDTLFYASNELKNDRMLVLAAVNQDGYALKYASVKLKNDRKLVLVAVKVDVRALLHISDELKNDREFMLGALKSHSRISWKECAEMSNDREIVLAAVTLDGNALNYASVELKNNSHIVLAAVTQNGDALKYASKELKNDREFVLAAVNQNGDALKYASMELKNNSYIVLAAVTQNGNALKYASNELKNDHEIVLAAVTQNGNALKYASMELNNYHEVVLAAVTQDGCSWIYASNELKNDREIVLAAMNQKGDALKYASVELKNDREIVLAAVTQNGNALKYASNELKNDREIVLAAVTQNGNALKYASMELNNYHEVVLAAVTQDGCSWIYASKELKNDREIVLAAMTQNGDALLYASVELKNDREIVLAAVTQNGYALKYASVELENDREIVLAAVTQNGDALKYASVELKNDREIVFAAMNQDGYALKYASVELKNDREIVLAAVTQNGLALRYASMELKKEFEILLVALASPNIQSWDSFSSLFENDPIILTQSSLYQDIIKNYMTSFNCFHNVFLFGWLAPLQDTKVRKVMTFSHGSCSKTSNLCLLNKLGKYPSIAVKKLIADYAGVKYDYGFRQKLVAAENVLKKKPKDDIKYWLPHPENDEDEDVLFTRRRLRYNSFKQFRSRAMTLFS